MARTKESLTKNQFTQELNNFFDAVNKQIAFGNQWQLKKTKDLLDTIKSSVKANKAYADKHTIKFDSKKLVSCLQTYALANWGLNTTENAETAKNAMDEFNNYIKSIDNDMLRKHLSNWPNQIKTIIDPMTDERLKYTDVNTGTICKSMTTYLKNNRSFHRYIRNIKYNTSSVITSVLMTIMKSYFPGFDNNKTNDELEALKKHILKSIPEKDFKSK